jgi:hypothetical protein
VPDLLQTHQTRHSKKIQREEVRSSTFEPKRVHIEVDLAHGSIKLKGVRKQWSSSHITRDRDASEYKD